MQENTRISSFTCSFRYQRVYEKGKPKHNKSDSFFIKHPPMELSRRARIFNPFDALKGFSETIALTETDAITRSEQPLQSSDNENNTELTDEYP